MDRKPPLSASFSVRQIQNGRARSARSVPPRLTAGLTITGATWSLFLPEICRICSRPLRVPHLIRQSSMSRSTTGEKNTPSLPMEQSGSSPDRTTCWRRSTPSGTAARRKAIRITAVRRKHLLPARRMNLPVNPPPPRIRIGNRKPAEKERTAGKAAPPGSRMKRTKYPLSTPSRAWSAAVISRNSPGT